MTCPLSINPKDRSMNRAQWKYLSRTLRTTWRTHGPAIERATVDTLIYGHRSLDLSDTTTTDHGDTTKPHIAPNYTKFAKG